jgi:hypothetical protein
VRNLSSEAGWSTAQLPVHSAFDWPLPPSCPPARHFRSAGAMKGLFSSKFRLALYTVGKAGSTSLHQFWKCAFKGEHAYNIFRTPASAIPGPVASAITSREPRERMASAYTETLSWTSALHLVVGAQGGTAQLVVFPQLPHVREAGGYYTDVAKHPFRQLARDGWLVRHEGARAFGRSAYEDALRRLHASDSAWILEAFVPSSGKRDELSMVDAMLTADDTPLRHTDGKTYPVLRGRWDERARFAAFMRAVQCNAVGPLIDHATDTFSWALSAMAGESRALRPGEQYVLGRTGDRTTPIEMRVVRTEQLNEDMARILAELNASAAAKVHARCGDVQQRNTGAHASASPEAPSGRRELALAVAKSSSAYASTSALMRFMDEDDALMRAVCRANWHDFACFPRFQLPRACDARHDPGWACRL